MSEQKEISYLYSNVVSCSLEFADGSWKTIELPKTKNYMKLQYLDVEAKNRFFADAVNVKMNTLMNKPATVSMLAKKCGYNSLKTFTRHFKKYLGITPYQWMMGKKMDYARSKLLTTTLSIDSVSKLSGFVNTSHFYKCYFDRFGNSPAQDRKMRRPGKDF
jgi:transcriptional regulator GlxA family with amidase domain